MVRNPTIVPYKFLNSRCALPELEFSIICGGGRGVYSHLDTNLQPGRGWDVSICLRSSVGW